ncbi:MAG: D-sedoheptulose 7-phosphate isomerase [Bacteroidota bacterium]
MLEKLIHAEILGHEQTMARTREQLIPVIETACLQVVECLRAGHKVLLCGNGGSAADAQHIATELTGRYKTTRRGLPAIALTTDTSALTAISNDFGYQEVFRRQVEALGQAGDVLIGISTSGNSPNVMAAIQEAKSIGCYTIGLLGKSGGKIASECDIAVVVPSDDTPRIQEMHILVGHLICEAVDQAWEKQ